MKRSSGASTRKTTALVVQLEQSRELWCMHPQVVRTSLEQTRELTRGTVFKMCVMLLKALWSLVCDVTDV
jgi:alpha-D-ribose 1-methylphosphonate 5-triphosphate synthase subunit PhnL